MGNVNRTNPTNPMVSDSSSVHGSASGGSSQSESWADPSSVWSGQSPYLENLYQMGQHRFGELAPSMAGASTRLYNNAQNALVKNMNPGMNPMLKNYAGAVGRNFEREIMPQINDQAAGFGQLGGSRQGVAQGLAAGEAQRNIQEFAGNLYNDDRNRMLQAASMAPQLGSFGMSIPWYALQQYSGILGRPTVLSGAAGSTSSSSNWGTSHGSSTSHSEGGGGGGGWGVGVSPLPTGVP